VIKIGDFARLGQVSVVTLRHYDDLGLLKPVAVDDFSGYRYYAVGQLPRLNRILALKDLGFSLEQIGQVLEEGLSLEQLRGMLMLKRAEVEQRVAQEQERLTRIEARLKQIEEENMMPTYDVVLKTVPPLRVASRRVTIPTNDQVPQYLGPAYREVSDYVRQQGAKVIDPCLAIWHTAADVYANEDAEAMLAVDRPLPSTERVQVYELPQVQAASVVTSGKGENFASAHLALIQWIEAHGYRISGPFREIYINWDKDDPADAATEIQYPVEKS
jgi:DNA-binding transcriptional MerR regulator